MLDLDLNNQTAARALAEQDSLSTGIMTVAGVVGAFLGLKWLYPTHTICYCRLDYTRRTDRTWPEAHIFEVSKSSYYLIFCQEKQIYC